MEKIDLHLHSNFSDGILPPEEIVLLSKKAGCTLISITDHEVINDYKDLQNQYNINIVSGIEFNTATTNMHILGYGISDYDKVNFEMKQLRLYNEKVCFEVIKKMQKDNYDISVDKIEKHLNDIGIKFDILDKRKIVKYLIFKGYSDNILDTYNKLIGVDKKYYVPNKKISPEEIIKLIKSSGGISSLAHPYTLKLDKNNLHKRVESLQKSGLDAIEVVNGKTNPEMIKEYKKLANILGLLQTVGTDFHTTQNSEIGIEVEDSIINNFRKTLNLKSKKH